MKSFDEKLYICETCNKHLYENEIPCQAVCNKMVLDLIPDELKDFKKTEKVLIAKIILFKKIAIMHGKGELFKIKESVYTISIEATNKCNILPRPAVSNGLIVVQLKIQGLCVYQALTYLKSCNKFYENISIAKGLSSEDMFKFSDVFEIQVQSERVIEKNVSDVKEMTDRSK